MKRFLILDYLKNGLYQQLRMATAFKAKINRFDAQPTGKNNNLNLALLEKMKRLKTYSESA